MKNKRKNKEERELYVNIGNRLLVKRRELHYTQEQMAELLEVSTGFYGMIERGEKAPSIEKLVKIYEKLGTDITYLLTGDEREERIPDYIEKCPREKQYDFEQLMKYALNLADIGTYNAKN
ncbi:MAG: helix-turn-helix domain-containing protein [Lachnospiraceae bacterium]|nr:helix-turn-helix domain-containing protein [Lachnospiraceae bacterium]